MYHLQTNLSCLFSKMSRPLVQARCRRHELGWLPRSQRLSPWHFLSCLCTKCFGGRDIWPKPGKSDSSSQDTATSGKKGKKKPCRQGCLCVHRDVSAWHFQQPLSWSPSNCPGPLFLSNPNLLNLMTFHSIFKLTKAGVLFCFVFWGVGVALNLKEYTTQSSPSVKILRIITESLTNLKGLRGACCKNSSGYHKDTKGKKQNDSHRGVVEPSLDSNKMIWF